MTVVQLLVFGLLLNFGRLFFGGMDLDWAYYLRSVVIVLFGDVAAFCVSHQLKTMINIILLDLATIKKCTAFYTLLFDRERRYGC
jgi:flagellar motor component MotA